MSRAMRFSSHGSDIVPPGISRGRCHDLWWSSYRHRLSCLGLGSIARRPSQRATIRHQRRNFFQDRGLFDSLPVDQVRISPLECGLMIVHIFQREGCDAYYATSPQTVGRWRRRDRDLFILFNRIALVKAEFFVPGKDYSDRLARSRDCTRSALGHQLTAGITSLGAYGKHAKSDEVVAKDDCYDQYKHDKNRVKCLSVTRVGDDEREICRIVKPSLCLVRECRNLQVVRIIASKTPDTRHPMAFLFTLLFLKRGKHRRCRVFAAAFLLGLLKNKRVLVPLWPVALMMFSSSYLVPPIRIASSLCMRSRKPESLGSDPTTGEEVASIMDRVDEGDRRPETLVGFVDRSLVEERPLLRWNFDAREARDLSSPITEWPWNQAENLECIWA